jgi:N-acyl-D-amino-acid deacylase
MFDVLIRNGLVLDGTGNPWTKLDIGIVGDRIVRIGDLKESAAATVIDASGCVVAPGFIDPHVHSDLLCTQPDIHKIKVLQGITTELLGQDGISVAPVSDETKPLWQAQLRGLDGDIGDWPWNTIDEYLEFLAQSNLNGNVAYLVPHGAVRTLVMGFAGRQATSNEIAQMRELAEEGMRQGCFGVSSGLIYPPNLYSDKAELVGICTGAAKHGGCFVVHIRNESHMILEALDEVIDVARQSGVRLHISHFKVAGHRNRHLYQPALDRIDAARAEGIEVTFDQYPYTAGSTVLHSILPPWMHCDGTEVMLARLADPDTRNRVKHDLAHSESYENWVRNCGWDKIVITSVATDENRWCEGKNLLQIAETLGKDPADTAIDLLIQERGNVTMVTHWGEEDDIVYAMQHPVQMVGSDSIFGGKPHPRLYGTFPRVLARFVREKNVMTLSDAVRRMTSASAQLLRLEGRGLLCEGYYADAVVFDPASVLDRATYDDPLQAPVGIQYVLVNGQLAVENSIYTGVTAGRVLRGERR